MKRLLCVIAMSLAAAGNIYSQDSGYIPIWWGANGGYAPDTEGALGIQIFSLGNFSYSFIGYSTFASLDYAGYDKYGELLISVLPGFNIGGIVHILGGGGIGFGWGDVGESMKFGEYGYDGDGDGEYDGGDIALAWKLSFGAALTLGPVALDAIASYGGRLGWQFYAGLGIKIGSDTPQPATKPAPKPQRYPTITKEELRNTELAYAKTVDYIDSRGKHLRINNLQERNEFIQTYRGAPNAGAVGAAKNTKFEWFYSQNVSQEDIVARAKKEPNNFLKVRMIHDWVSDVFIYDHDYLNRMMYVTGRNEKYTLAQIVSLQRGVCFEYAILFWFLLDAAGLDVYLISDHSAQRKDIGHAYNMVVINNTGYIVDTTWDSGNHYINGRVVEYQKMNSKEYFMPDVSRSFNLRRSQGW